MEQIITSSLSSSIDLCDKYHHELHYLRKINKQLFIAFAVHFEFVILYSILSNGTTYRLKRIQFIFVLKDTVLLNTDKKSEHQPI